MPGRSRPWVFELRDLGCVVALVLVAIGVLWELLSGALHWIWLAGYHAGHRH